MTRIALSLGLVLGATGTAKLPPALPVQLTEIASPVGPGASSASVTTAPDGTVWLSWLEPAGAVGTALRCATLDPAAARWRGPRTIAAGRDLLANSSDMPSLAIEPDGCLTAVWPVSVGNSMSPAAGSGGHHRHEKTSAARFSQSRDRGATWSPPAPLSRESSSNEFVAVETLGDGRVLATWLDARGKSGERGVQQLFARVLGSKGPDVLVDASVCDCCQTTLTRFPDGSALLAYRGRTGDETRDIRVARFQDDQWERGRLLNPDGWQIAGCPVNGPQLASVGGRAGIAWFTAAHGEPRVLASVSPDAGARFLQPIRLDHGQPLGRVDTAMLADGSLLVTWLEGGATPGLWLARIPPDFSPGQAVRLAALEPTRLRGFLRLALVKDYDSTPARLVVAFMGDDAVGALQTLLVTLPDLSTLAGRKPCVPCDEQDAAAVRGYAVKGRIVSVSPERGTVVVQHEEIPGVMRAMTMEFHAAPDVVAEAKPGRPLLARIERRGQPWWIFGVKWLGETP